MKKVLVVKPTHTIEIKCSDSVYWIFKYIVKHLTFNVKAKKFTLQGKEYKTVIVNEYIETTKK